MNYQVTCFCGNRLLVADHQIGTAVTCPACKRELLPTVSGAAPPPTTVKAEGAPAEENAPEETAALPAAAEATKRCPFCGEVILAVAKKCKHCGEFLDRAAPHPDPAVEAARGNPGGAGGGPPIFEMSVSQWDNFWKYVICVAAAVLVCGGLIVLAQRAMIGKQAASLGVPITLAVLGFIAWMFYLSVKNSRCFIRPTRIDTEVGILSKEMNSIELFRITDMELKQSLFERLLGIGTIRIASSDPKTPELVLYLIPKARRVHKYLQDQIPVATKQRGAVFYER